MADPATLSAAVIGSAALTEGIKFLYGQAGEILKRWRERRNKPREGQPETESIRVELPQAAFQGSLDELTIHFEAVSESEEQLRQLRKQLSDYAEGVDAVEENNQDLLQSVGALRGLLEAIYRQHITFRGEDRPQSGVPLVAGFIEVEEEIADEASGVHVEENIAVGEVRGRVRARRIEKGGKVTGVKARSIGPTKPKEPG